MAEQKSGLLDRTLHQMTMAKWARAARYAEDMDFDALRQQRSTARQLRQHLEKLLTVAERRLILPKEGNQNFPRPEAVDWSWRPPLWCDRLPVPGVSSAQSGTRMSPEVTLFHDCAFTEVTLRQVRNTTQSDLAAYGLRLDVFKFHGSYLSVAVQLPDSALEGLKRDHILRMETIVEMEKPLEIFARLNIRHGPNTEQIVRELPLYAEDIRVEFDLAYTKLNEKRLSRMWVDLIFERPEMNQVTLRDLTFNRRPRAKL
ncbi:DUF6478 family protein [Pseudoprimorskyibacter insulae]|uniref:Uncharacterized protein n=1 Tax=Pseudoprimorskyibacter insulae TaxID=1695997 RepID=A0A2R8AYV6_9RHOB|nr:DUF6478 family protein [Pseudoprimorskyibacter insulae]SPF81226.1 hypothetical protein PRI8871_03048 [Pseudoprimorskyibacter insulae]